MTPEEKSGREKAMQEMRDWQAKKKAEREAKGIPEPPEFQSVPSVTFEPLEEIEISQRPAKPFIKYIRSLQDAPDGDAQDFVVKSRLHDKIAEDSEKTGCTQYVVLNEGEQYCVWRLPR